MLCNEDDVKKMVASPFSYSGSVHGITSCVFFPKKPRGSLLKYPLFFVFMKHDLAQSQPSEKQVNTPNYKETIEKKS